MTLPTDDGPMRWGDLVPAALLLLGSVLALGLLASQPTRDQRQVAVLVPVWDSPLEAATLVAAAGGSLVDNGGLPNVFIATSANPGFARALYRAGAWFVMNPIASRGCRPALPAKQSI